MAGLSMEDVFRSSFDIASGALKVNLTAVGAYSEVLNYASLPSAASASGKIYFVKNTTGLVFKKYTGFYYSNGTSWIAAPSELKDTFDDSVMRIYKHADDTSLAAFDLTAISPSTTRTITMPDRNINLGTLLSTVSVDGTTITGNGTPASPLVSVGGGGGIPEAPIDGQQYARKNAGWVVVTSGGGSMATFDGVLDFTTGQNLVTATIADATMTDTKVIQPFYTSKLDEVAVLDMKVTEKSRTVGVGFELTGFAPNKAFGQYNVRCIVSGS